MCSNIKKEKYTEEVFANVKTMATFHWQDNLSSTAFTPRDFQVELLAAAFEKNIIVCLGHNSSKEFITLKLILEKSFELRGKYGERKITLILTNSPTGGESMFNLLFHLTDLKVINVNSDLNDTINWEQCLHDYQVIILNVAKCLNAAKCGFIGFALVNLIVIEDCHKNYSNLEFIDLFKIITHTIPIPKILGLAGPLHSAGCATDQLGFHLEILEKSVQCKAETASDIVTVLR